LVDKSGVLVLEWCGRFLDAFVFGGLTVDPFWSCSLIKACFFAEGFQAQGLEGDEGSIVEYGLQGWLELVRGYRVKMVSLHPSHCQVLNCQISRDSPMDLADHGSYPYTGPHVACPPHAHFVASTCLHSLSDPLHNKRIVVNLP